MRKQDGAIVSLPHEKDVGGRGVYEADNADLSRPPDYTQEVEAKERPRIELDGGWTRHELA
jgi:hypothetical protein